MTNAFGSNTETKSGTMAPGATSVAAAPQATPTAAAMPITTVPVATVTTSAPAAIPTAQETQMPGFEGILAVAGLGGFVFLVKRR